MQITVDVPPELAQEVDRYRDHLPELLRQGVAALQVTSDQVGQDEVEIMQILASRPTPEEIMALQPSSTMQSRVSSLLAKNKAERLTTAEERELERFLTLEHLVRLAKMQAYQTV